VESAVVWVRAPELRCALDLRHHLDCGARPALDAALVRSGWGVKRSRSTGEWYYVRSNPSASQWERPGASREAAASCACVGHRNSAKATSHCERVSRKLALMHACEAKRADFERDAAPAASTAGAASSVGLPVAPAGGVRATQSYYEWCRSRCAATFSPPDGAASTLDEHITHVFGLMRDYDHEASDSEFSHSADADEDEDEYDSFPDDAAPRAPRPSAKRRRTEKVLRAGIEAFIDSPGVASRILHGDGTNRTRSGRKFGGELHDPSLPQSARFNFSGS